MLLKIAIALAMMIPAASHAESKIRNVLFIISDDLKADALGCYGNPACKTPSIDELATRGMVFENAYCQGVWCAPSRESFMFSQYQLGKKAGNPNLGEHLRKNGLYTARVGKIYHMRVPGDIIDGTNGADIESSWTERFNSQGQEAHTPGDYACLNLNIFTKELEGRQSTKMPHRMFVTVEYDGDGSDQPDHKSATKAIELLNEHKNEPFFLAVGLVRPHYPNVAPRQYFTPYPYKNMELPETVDNDTDDIPKPGLANTRSETNPIGKYPDNQRRMWSGYYATVQFMDEQVGRILGELDRLGLRESTAIVFTSDHGYHLGEHGFWQKANLHEDVTRIPLVVSAPGLPAGRTKSLVELVDVYPTVCELLGVQPPNQVQGTSVIPALRDPDASIKDAAISVDRSGIAIRTSEWAYMRYKDGSEELYDMVNDPHQFSNLAFKEKAEPHAKTLEKMRSHLERLGTKHSLSIPDLHATATP